MSNRRGRPRYDDLLTPAEWRVAELVRHGMTNARIAAAIGVSLDAVKFHVGNALSKLGFTSRHELRLWSGVAKGRALDQWRRTMNSDHANGAYMMLGQVARTAKDPAAARQWYRDVLGLPELYAFGNLSFFDLGGIRLMISEAEGVGPQESILYLRVPDLHAEKDRLEANGVRFTHAPHMIHRHEDGTEEWMAFFEDNEGRPLALMTQVRSEVR